MNDEIEHLTARLGKQYMVPSNEIITSEAGAKHLKAFEDGCEEWLSYHSAVVPEEVLVEFDEFVFALLSGREFKTEKQYNQAISDVRKVKHITPSKPQIVRSYHRLLEASRVPRHDSFERIATKKSVRSNSGVVVITIVTAPGKFSCPNDCHYCPDEPGQPRSYLSTEPAVARANQNEFDPVRQFYDRACTLAKQGHTVDKIEVIVLGGTWSHYPKDYQEEFCRDVFYAANTFDESKAKLGGRGMTAANTRPRRSILEEQQLNEKAIVKIIGLTLETRPDWINTGEVRRLRNYGCTRVQIGVQHTDDEILRYINRGHDRAAAVKATALLKTCGFKVDIHLMPDLPSSDLDKDRAMFKDVLHGDELQADHWKIYPCEVTPFTKIEQWYKDGKYMPYTETDPALLVDLLAGVKAEVHPWIRLNRVIRDIPEVSIIAGNANTNLRQCIFEELKSRGKSCRCIRCREVRDWPETAEGLRLRVREYRSSNGTEYFISIEGSNRGLGGGATQRALAGGEKVTKKEKKAKKDKRHDQAQHKDMLGQFAATLEAGGSREERKAAAEAAIAARAAEEAAAAAAEPHVFEEEDLENATLYGLLRLRFNDNASAPRATFPELDNCALIRELHVYGQLMAAVQAGDGSTSDRGDADSRPQHIGIGRTLMGTAELIAAAHGWKKISVIAGVGVRNYYRRLGYSLQGAGQYLIKDLPPCPESEKDRAPASFETSFIAAAQRVNVNTTPQRKWPHLATAAVGLAAVAIMTITLSRRWRAKNS